MKVRRQTNSGVADGVSTTEPTAAGWRDLDELPRAVRQILWGAPISINPSSAGALTREGGEEYAVKSLIGAIYEEVVIFARQHETRHGYMLPAISADVAPLRFEAPRQSAKAPARRRPEIIRRRRRSRRLM